MPYSAPSDYRPASILLWTLGYECLGLTNKALATVVWASTAWPTNNLAIFLPFELTEAIVIARAGIFQGTAPNTGNFDIGVYDEGFNRIASLGTTARSLASDIQSAALAATIPAGRGYLAYSQDSTVAVQMFATLAAKGAGMGLFQQASAFPLPNPATPALYAQAVVPLFGVTTRSSF